MKKILVACALVLLTAGTASAETELFTSPEGIRVVKAVETTNKYFVFGNDAADLFSSVSCTFPTCGAITATESVLYPGWWSLGSAGVKDTFDLVKIGPASIATVWNFTLDDALIQDGTQFRVYAGMNWSETESSYTAGGITITVHPDGTVAGNVSGILSSATPELIFAWDESAADPNTTYPLYPASFPAVGVSWDEYPPNTGHICGWWYPVPGKGACQNCQYTTTRDEYDMACDGRFWQRFQGCVAECQTQFPIINSKEFSSCRQACYREWRKVTVPHQNDPCFRRTVPRTVNYRNCWPFAD